jgi:RHS repeat-associated protein
VLQEFGPDGNISYAYGLGLISESGPKFDYFYHYDGLGSVVTLSDESGTPAAAYLYDAWGNPLLTIRDRVGTRNKFRFTGEALDTGTQMYYLRQRYYDPTSGRFVSRDVLPGTPGNPQTLNRYVYALDAPLVYTDPSGLFSLGGILNSISQTANAIGSGIDAAFVLSAVTLAQGPIQLGGTIASVLGGSGVAQVNQQANSYINAVKRNLAAGLVSSTAALENVQLSNQQADLIAGQVVSVTDFASTVASILGAPEKLTDFDLAYLRNGGSAIVPIIGAIEAFGETAQSTISELKALTPGNLTGAPSGLYK